LRTVVRNVYNATHWITTVKGLEQLMTINSRYFHGAPRSFTQIANK